MQKIRLFVSSPSDVAAERRRVDNVVNRIKLDYEGVEFDVIRWEEAFYTARSTFQEQIASPADVDIVLCILWKRLGSPLPDDYQREDGSTPTGTEYEFETAMEAALSGELPDILVYRKTAAISFKAEQVEQEQAELQALESFWRRWIQNEKGHYTAGFKPFEETDEFEQQLEKDLRAWLKRRFHHVTWPESKGSPYRGLDVFDEEHAAIYFGRRRAINEVRARLLANQQRDGVSFLLIIGASGAGKSSLVRAGLIPALKENNPIEGVAGWRTVVLRPTELGTDPVHGLVSHLYGHSVLAELSQGDYSQPRDLSGLWKSSPSMAAKPVEAALKRWGKLLAEQEQMSATAETRLLITIDQFEELFQFDTDQQIAFLNVIDSLSRSGNIWVIATMRSDFYPQLFSLPELMNLKDASRQYDLSIPRPHELQEIITGPALAAGLGFEKNSHTEGLEQRLLEDAEGNPGALPLLEFTLERLYQERDRENKQLTFDAYQQLGGLEGALTQTAEDSFSAIEKNFTDNSAAIFARVMRELVAIDEQGKATRRVAQVDKFSRNTDDKLLVDTLLNSRLLTGYTAETSDSDKPHAVVNITHEALIHHWDRVQHWLEQDQELLQVRERIDQDCQRWLNESKRRDMLATSGKRLEDIRYLKNSGLQLDKGTTDFIDASLVRAGQLQKRKRILQAGFSAVSITAAIFGVITLNSLSELSAQRDEISKKEQILIKSNAASTALIAETEYAKANLLSNQKNNIAALASYYKSITRARESGEIRRGNVAADVEQRSEKNDTLNTKWLADTLSQANWHVNALNDSNRLASGRNYSPLISPDKNIVLALGNDKNLGRYASLFRLSDKSRLAGPFVTNIKFSRFNVRGAAFTPDSKNIAITIEDSSAEKTTRSNKNYTVNIIDTATGKLGKKVISGDNAKLIAFLDNDRLIISADDRNTLSVWNIRNTTPENLQPVILTDYPIEKIDVINSKLLLLNNTQLWQEQKDGEWLNIASITDIDPFDLKAAKPRPITTENGFVNVVNRYDTWLPDWFMNLAARTVSYSYGTDHWITNLSLIKMRPQFAITRIVANQVYTEYRDIPLPEKLNKSDSGYISIATLLSHQKADNAILFLCTYLNLKGDENTYSYELPLGNVDSISQPQLVLASKSYDFKLITGVSVLNSHSMLFSSSNGELYERNIKNNKILTTRPTSRISGMVDLDDRVLLASSTGTYLIEKSTISSDKPENQSPWTKNASEIFSIYQYLYGKSAILPQISYDKDSDTLKLYHLHPDSPPNGKQKELNKYIHKPVDLANVELPITADITHGLTKNRNANPAHIKPAKKITASAPKLAIGNKLTATASNGGRINIVNTTDNKRFSFTTRSKTNKNAQGIISVMQWHPTRAILATADWQGGIHLFSVSTHKATSRAISSALHKNQAAISKLTWSPDGTMLASGDRQGMVNLWHIQQGASASLTNKTQLKHDSGIVAIHYSSDGQWIITATDTDKLYFWRADGTPLGKPLTMQDIQIRDVFITDDNWGIIIVSKTGRRYFIEAGDRFIPDRILDYFDLLTRDTLFKEQASTRQAHDSTSVLDYYSKPPATDRTFWTAIVNRIVTCQQNAVCRNGNVTDSAFKMTDKQFSRGRP